MQEPKFRGIDKETGEWIYGFGWLKTDYTKEYLKEIRQTTQDAVLYTEKGTFLCDLETMRKSTEQRDDDNIELFEGDICIVNPTLLEHTAPFKAEIVWDKARFAFYYLSDNPQTTAPPLMSFDSFGLSIKKIATVHD